MIAGPFIVLRDRNDEDAFAIATAQLVQYELRNSGARLHDRVGDAQVDTVFLGVQHFELLWCTQIRGGAHDGYRERYHTHDEATAGHARVLGRLTGTWDAA
mgnify:FL=1